MQLQAKARLIADEVETNKIAKEQIDHKIEQKKGQIENTKKGLPSRENRMKVSPEQRNRAEKQIHRMQEDKSDLQLKKDKIGAA
jgi:hypothetical protein